MTTAGLRRPKAISLLVAGLLIGGGAATCAAGNMVRNSGFEDGTTGWAVPGQLYALDDSVGHAGGHSLRFHNEPGGPYLLASQALPLQPGKCYRMAVWVRTEGIVSTDTGATVCMEWSGAKGYIGGAYPPGLMGTHDWQQIVYETGPVPPDATGGSVTVYGRSGTHGTAWFDDVEVTEVSPLARIRFGHLPPDVRRTRLFLDDRGGVTFQAQGAPQRRGELKGLVFSVTIRRGPQSDRFDAPKWEDDRAEIAIPAKALGAGETLAEVSLRSRADDRPVAGDSFWLEGARRVRLDTVKPNPAGVLGLRGHPEHRLQVRVPVDPGDGGPHGQWRARISWRADGRPVGSPVIATVEAGRANTLQVPVPVGLRPGIYDLRCEVARAGGGAIASDQVLVTVADPTQRPANATWIGPNRMLMVDGSPFFPMGFYLVSSLPTVFPVDEPYHWTDSALHPEYYLPILDRLASSHFNCAIDYSSTMGGLDQARELMDAAEARGLRVIFSVKDLMKGAYWELFTRNLPWQDLRAANRGVVESFRDHPALIGWYINDEVFAPDLWPGAVNVFRDTRETDPWHPTYAVHYDYKGIGTYRGACDAIGTDPYTLLGDIGFTARSWHEARKLMGPDQPFWAVVQCFGPGYEVSNPSETREPTFEEERAATLAAVAEGATGIIYYCFHSLQRSPRFEERFTELDRIAAEVQGLMPIITLPDAREPVTATQGDSISVLSKQAIGRVHVLLVSTSREAQEIVVALPPGVTEVKDAATGEILPVGERALRLHIDALGTRLLEATRGPGTHRGE